MTQFIREGLSGAVFSADRLHRFSLWRRFREGCKPERMIPFCGLNPSTADEKINDPTVARCQNFAKLWGYDGMVMLNAFAFRATDPKDMKRAADPIGRPVNDQAILEVVRACGRVVCCWGNHGEFLRRGAEVCYLLSGWNFDVFHLGLNNSGHPKHPLYLRADTERILWKPEHGI